MTVAQGHGAVIWDLITLGMSILIALCIWYFTIVGRGRDPEKQRAGEEHVETYGDVQENHAPVPKFIIWTIVVVIVWTLGYAISTGIFGLY